MSEYWKKNWRFLLMLILLELVMIGDKIFLGDNRGVSDGFTSADLVTYILIPLAILQMITSSFYEK